MNKETRKALQSQLDLRLADLANYAHMVTEEDKDNLRLLVQIMTMDSLNRIASQLEDGQIAVITNVGG